MSFVSLCDNTIDYALKQIMREVRHDQKFLRGNRATRRQMFLTHLASSLNAKYPYANVVIIRNGQTHLVNADAVMRKVQGPIPGLTDFMGLSSADYWVYLCKRGSFTNFGHGGPLDLKWCGNVEKSRSWSPRSQTLLLR